MFDGDSDEEVGGSPDEAQQDEREPHAKTMHDGNWWEIWRLPTQPTKSAPLGIRQCARGTASPFDITPSRQDIVHLRLSSLPGTIRRLKNRHPPTSLPGRRTSLGPTGGDSRAVPRGRGYSGRRQGTRR